MQCIYQGVVCTYFKPIQNLALLNNKPLRSPLFFLVHFISLSADGALGLIACSVQKATPQDISRLSILG